MKKTTLILAMVMYFSSFLALAGQIKNLGNPMPGVYRGVTLKKHAQFKELKGLGVHVLISVKKREPNYEKSSHYGFKYIHYPTVLLPWVDALGDTSPSLIKAYWKIKDLLAEGKKVYLHCFHGSDRTGLVIAALQLTKVLKENNNTLSDENKNKILGELYSHGYHSDLFPGVRKKIEKWMKKAPAWFTKKPDYCDASS